MGLALNCSKILKEILVQNDHITILNISKNLIGDQGIEIISSAFPLSVSLVHLDISSNSITWKGAFHLFQYLRKNETLACLNLSSFPRCPKNNFSELNKTLIIDYLASTNQLLFLELNNCFMVDSSIECLGKGMIKNQSIIKIDLSNNLFTENCAKSVVQILKASKLHTLHISGNQFKNYFKSEVAKFLYRSNQIFCKKIYFCKCGFTEYLNQDFFISLVNVPSINALYFDKNNFASSNSYLQYLFMNTLNLKHLSLSYCFLNDDSMNQISFGLKVCQSISSINLSNNFISDPGIILLCGALFENFGRINRLDISFNKINDESCIHISELINIDYPLYYLNLTGNNISSLGGEKIAFAVKKNNFIIYLELKANLIDQPVLNEIQLFIMKNINKIKTKKHKTIEDYIQENVNVTDDCKHVEDKMNKINFQNNFERQNIEKLKKIIENLESSSSSAQLLTQLDLLEKENSDFDLILDQMNKSIL